MALFLLGASCVSAGPLEGTQQQAAMSRSPVDNLPVARTYSHPDIVLAAVGNYVVAGGGDLNADGLPDLLTSNYGYWTTAYAYLGTGTGVATDPDTTFAGLENDGGDEIPIAFAGDIDGDGHDDVIATANSDAQILLWSGTTVAHTGPPDPTWTLPDHADDFEGEVAWVDGAGDVNGDGYADVVVGMPHPDSGNMSVHLGSAAGPLDDDTTFSVTSMSPEFGHTVRGAGDVNGDGFGDVVVSGDAYTSAVYYGSASGMSASAFTTLNHTTMARSVAGAGDVNGDGYDDVLVGMPDASPSGEVDLFLGGPDGVNPTAAWSRLGQVAQYGWSVDGAGDVNGDGFADVIVGVPAHAERLDYVEVILGEASGLQPEPLAILAAGGDSVAGAGDIDRDGLADVIVCGGEIFLGSTLMDPSRADPPEDTGDADSDADSDTDSDSDTDGDSLEDTAWDSADSGNGGSPGGQGGCAGGKSGCDALGLMPGFAPLIAGLGLVVGRRRPAWG